MRLHLSGFGLFFSVLVSIAAHLPREALANPTLPKCEEQKNDAYIVAMNIVSADPVAQYLLLDQGSCDGRLAKGTFHCKVAPLLRRDLVGPRLLKEVTFGMPLNQSALRTSLALIAKVNPKINVADFIDLKGKIKSPPILQYFNHQSPAMTGPGQEPKPQKVGQVVLPLPSSVTSATYTTCDDKSCCYRLTSPDTAALDPDSREKKVDVFHAGISMVGALYPTDSNSSFSQCSFVMLSRNLGLTALHCLFAQNAQTFKEGLSTDPLTIAGQNTNLKWVLWTPRRTATKQSVIAGVNSCSGDAALKDCDFTLLRHKQVLFPTANVAHPPGLPDIAIVEFDEVTSLPSEAIHFPSLDFSVPLTVDDLTAVGFGRAQDVKDCNSKPCKAIVPPFGPQVGWVSPSQVAELKAAPIPASPGLYTMEQFPGGDKLLSMPCSGDSGGGVFLGFMNGNPNIKGFPPLLGIVHSKTPASSPDGKAATCKDMQTKVISPKAFKSKICGQIPSDTKARVGLEVFCKGP